MRLHDHPETDSLSIALRWVPSADPREIEDGGNVDGQIVGCHLSTLDTIDVPVTTPEVA